MAPSLSARVAIVGLLGLGMAVAGCDRKSPDAGQATTNTAVASADEAAPDEMPATDAATLAPGAIDRSQKGDPAPTQPFTTPDGKTVTLADFKGRPVLVNLWATWCAPCVKELPTLDATAAAMDGKIEVLTISQDMDPAKVAPFLAGKKLTQLKPYTDKDMGMSLALAANLPTTLLIDAQGREVWRAAGDRDWTSAESRKAIGEAG